MEPVAPKAVFLSYASQDAEAARRIADALRAFGVEVWFDQQELRGGDAWDQKIRKQIKECTLFLPIISAHTQERAEGYFRLEWKLAVDRSHLLADDAPFLLPIVIDRTTDAVARVPDKFRDVQWSRLPGGETPRAFADRVREMLVGLAAAERRSGAGPQGNADHDAVPGWRPAAGLAVPGTPWIMEAKLGEGGFGEVWLGRHQTMKEPRVFKFCFRADRVRSLKRELTLFRVLKERVGGHPNIVRLLDVHFDEPPCYVEMDFVEGQNLKIWCDEQGGVERVPLAERLEIVAQIAEALQAAHSAGVLHRDVKPGNILVSPSAPPEAHPRAKLSDFGIGQVVSEEVLQGVTKGGFTQSVLGDSSSAHSGTQLYMAPELLAGEPASPQSDLYSLGVVFYQLVVGDLRRPVTTDWAKAIDDPLIREDLARCFAGKPEERFSCVGELAERLRAMDQRRATLAKQQATEAARQQATQRWKLVRAVGLAAVVVGLGTSTAWFLQRNAKLRLERETTRLRWEQQTELIRRAREVVLPEIQKLVEGLDFFAAYDLAVQVEKYLPTDPALTGLWPMISAKVTIETTPPGASIYYKEYRKPETEWRYLGKSPVQGVRMARAFCRWQMRKEGYVLEESASLPQTLSFPLSKVGSIPANMVRIRALPWGSSALPKRFALSEYLLDRFEVSNRQYQEFVDQGGYSNPRFWTEPFTEQEKVLKWEEAMARFRDTTGRPGPATWANGTHPEGKADYPVVGVSWYEAAAFAAFAGKRLPSIYHWRLAAANEPVAPLSNFDGSELTRVGGCQGMNRHGAYDMAGNAKEWCWNEAGDGRRYILGGGYGEPEYMYTFYDALSPFSRAAMNGFRCIKPLEETSEEKAADECYIRVERDYAKAEPVNDTEYSLIRRQFSYDKMPLEARVEASYDGDPQWRREKISVNAAYNNERLTMIVFLPKNVPPPYQCVVVFPNGSNRNSSFNAILNIAGTQLGSAMTGRAIVRPVFKGTFGRNMELSKRPLGPSEDREYHIHLAKDLGRTLDYLETRPDIQSDKFAYFGHSWGASVGPILTAVESRFRVNVFSAGGFPVVPLFAESMPLPEIDWVNHAPRVTTPTLMLNGRADFLFPLEPSQRPMFRLLGTPEEHKRHALFDSGHSMPVGGTKIVLQWLDTYLGPVKK